MDKIYEDGSLGGLKDNSHASKFKQRREHSIENWENSVESQRKALEQEKQKLYFAQAEEQIDQIECNFSNGKLEQAPDWNIINRERKD